LAKADVPLKLEEGEMPLNTFSNKAPFIAKIKSVQRIVGPKATGETCHIVIETQVDMKLPIGLSSGIVHDSAFIAGKDSFLGGVRV
jgi:ferredoxin--NADP+ reductase